MTHKVYDILVLNESGTRIFAFSASLKHIMATLTILILLNLSTIHALATNYIAPKQKNLNNSMDTETISTYLKELDHKSQELAHVIDTEHDALIGLSLNHQTPLGPLSNTDHHRPNFAPVYAESTPEITVQLSRANTFEHLIQEYFKRIKGLQERIEKQEIEITRIPTILPAHGILTSGFGRRRDPLFGTWTRHEGLDIAGDIGDPIYAPADGIIDFSGDAMGYGTMVSIDHENGLLTRFAHLHKSFVQKGQNIKRGDVIGLLGTTGKSTGPHLHYEIIENGVAVDPMKYLSR